MLTLTQIGDFGEHHVAALLKSWGYSTKVDTKFPGSTDIEAVKLSRGLLVQVKAAVSPNSPAWISDDEIEKIVSRANRLKFQAWEARVIIDAYGRRIGDIGWRQLN